MALVRAPPQLEFPSQGSNAPAAVHMRQSPTCEVVRSGEPERVDQLDADSDSSVEIMVIHDSCGHNSAGDEMPPLERAEQLPLVGNGAIEVVANQLSTQHQHTTSPRSVSCNAVAPACSVSCNAVAPAAAPSAHGSARVSEVCRLGCAAVGGGDTRRRKRGLPSGRKNGGGDTDEDFEDTDEGDKGTGIDRGGDAAAKDILPFAEQGIAPQRMGKGKVTPSRLGLLGDPSRSPPNLTKGHTHVYVRDTLLAKVKDAAQRTDVTVEAFVEQALLEKVTAEREQLRGQARASAPPILPLLRLAVLRWP